MAANIIASSMSNYGAIATSIASASSVSVIATTTTTTIKVAAAAAAASSSSSSLIGLSITSWYSASLANNYATPTLLDLLGSPLTLNMLEQAAMMLVAVVALPVNGIPLLPNFQTLTTQNTNNNNDTTKKHHLSTIHLVFAMGLANAITARWFMISLQHLPLSLCHTIRACSPCVAAAIGLLRRKHFSSLQWTSLPVIVAGFALAVSAQPSCSIIGVYAAIGSLLAMSALQHLSKELLERGMHEMQCQFLQCSLCFFFLALEPRNYVYSLNSHHNHKISSTSSTTTSLINNHNHNNNNHNRLHPFQTVWKLAMNSDPTQRARTRSFRLLTLLNGASDYIENVAATHVCANFDELTFSIFDTLRRLSVILICGMGLRQNPANFSNVAGTMLVLVGALLYQRGSSSTSTSTSTSNSNSNSSSK